MKVGVIGAGTMGQGIAKAFAQTEPGDLFPETGSRADDDLLLYRRPVPA